MVAKAVRRGRPRQSTVGPRTAVRTCMRRPRYYGPRDVRRPGPAQSAPVQGPARGGGLYCRTAARPVPDRGARTVNRVTLDHDGLPALTIF